MEILILLELEYREVLSNQNKNKKKTKHIPAIVPSYRIVSCLSLCHMLRDVINGEVPLNVRKRLTRCRIILRCRIITLRCRIIALAKPQKKKKKKKNLAQKLKKHEAIFRRLKLMGLNNISLLLLSKSVNIRHRYHTRVHTPAASEKLCKQFDKEVEEVMRTWLGKMSDKHISWCRLPVKKGGLGLPSSAETRNAAYNSSKRVSLERCKINSARLTHDEEMMRESEVVSDDGAVTDAMLNQKVYQELTKKNEEVAPLVKACSEKGNHDWLQGRTRCIPSSFNDKDTVSVPCWFLYLVDFLLRLLKHVRSSSEIWKTLHGRHRGDIGKSSAGYPEG